MKLTKKDMAEMSGMNLRKIQYYTEAISVFKIFNSGNGTGNRRQYTIQDAYLFRVIKYLTKWNISSTAIDKVITSIVQGDLYFEDLIITEDFHAHKYFASANYSQFMVLHIEKFHKYLIPD